MENENTNLLPKRIFLFLNVNNIKNRNVCRFQSYDSYIYVWVEEMCKFFIGPNNDKARWVRPPPTPPPLLSSYKI
ncbi:hypothetical protein BLOT_000196 [Blomia tropicalis]|nr:hypothetical protein BLOT_000196 [Blomia tropicalis]